jgi:hypothetical protein
MTAGVTSDKYVNVYVFPSATATTFTALRPISKPMQVLDLMLRIPFKSARRSGAPHFRNS